MFLKSELNFFFSLRSSFFKCLFLFKRWGAIAKRAIFANTWLVSARLARTLCAAMKGAGRVLVGFSFLPAMNVS